MLENYKQKQSDFYNYINCLKKNKKFSHAYLIETNGVSYAFSLAMDLAKFFLCHGQTDCEHICNLIDSGNYPDLVIVDTNHKIIKKDDMIELQKKFSLKPSYGNFMIYIIKDAAFFNRSSANTILKFLEEPKEGIIAILLAESQYQVLDTISSRCQILSLEDDFDVLKHCFDLYALEDSSYENFIKEDIPLCMDFLLKLQTKKIDLLLENLDFKNRMSFVFEIGYYFYYDAFRVSLGKEVLFFKDFSQKIEKIVSLITIDDIIKKIELFHNYMSKSSFNLNKDLVYDSFIIDFYRGDIND